ncbi:hypothetical protein GIB67_037220 [Kingdonia uniflora]|uniref:Pentatricopeptide repeat-containing protein n=1 Tax=Kingdonia uniflora TaxID=39325 RepID=A0A7J7MS40_9MAGN|nr:hypothetical protein GIB67_037220 [Kingdonia uniflora]
MYKLVQKLACIESIVPVQNYYAVMSIYKVQACTEACIALCCYDVMSRTVMLLCCYACKVQEASLLFIKMQEEGLKPGKVSYNIMLNIYATVGLVDEAEKLFEAIIMTMGACSRKNGRLQYCEWYSKFVSCRLNHCLKMISIVQKGKFGVTPTILVYF